MGNSWKKKLPFLPPPLQACEWHVGMFDLTVPGDEVAARRLLSRDPENKPIIVLLHHIKTQDFRPHPKYWEHSYGEPSAWTLLLSGVISSENMRPNYFQTLALRGRAGVHVVVAPDDTSPYVLRRQHHKTEYASAPPPVKDIGTVDRIVFLPSAQRFVVSSRLEKSPFCSTFCYPAHEMYQLCRYEFS